MDVNEIFELHRRSKSKVNLVYQRPSGRLGHCYIDPTKPLKRTYKGSNYGRPVETLEELQVSDVLVGVFKQANDVEIFVAPKDLWIHSGRVEQVVKILYGKSN